MEVRLGSLAVRQVGLRGLLPLHAAVATLGVKLRVEVVKLSLHLLVLHESVEEKFILLDLILGPSTNVSFQSSRRLRSVKKNK